MKDPMAGATWRKSTRSKDGECVEVAITPHAVGIRDSKVPAGPMLRLSREAFADLISDVKAGTFDL